MRSFKVVLVDDNDVDLMVHEKLLKIRGIADDIAAFERAKQALEHLEKLAYAENKSPILILLDLQMPDIDGFQFLKAFNYFPETFKARCKIIFISSAFELNQLQQLENTTPISGYLSKPLYIDDLKEKLEELFPN